MTDETAPAPETAPPIYRTAAEIAGVMQTHEMRVTPGLSHSPGLQALPDSTAPSTATGAPVPHVFGPGQNPVDPVAAGLDTTAILTTRNDNRVVTLTGADAAGPRPFTYIEKTGPDMVKQAADATGEHVPVPPAPTPTPPDPAAPPAEPPAAQA